MNATELRKLTETQHHNYKLQKTYFTITFASSVMHAYLLKPALGPLAIVSAGKNCQG